MKETTIGLLQAHNPLNCGNMLLCENTIHYLSGYLPEAFFVIPTQDRRVAEQRFRAALGDRNFGVTEYSRPPRILKGITGRLSFVVGRQLLFRYRDLRRAFKGCEVVLVLGGDEISESYSALALLHKLLQLRHLKREGRKIYLLSQSIGPVHSWRIPVTRNILGQMDGIYHRAPESFRFVTQELGVGRSSQAADLGFLDLARQNDAYRPRRFTLESGSYMTFVPSGFWAQYALNRKTYMEGLVRLTGYLLARCRERGLDLLLMPHVFADFDDRILLRKIVDMCRDRRLLALDEILLPYQARAVLGSSVFVVSQRMHGAISSFQTGVPALSLSYSQKFRDVIGHYLGFPELVVEVNKTRFSNDLERCFPAIEAALANITGLKSRVEEAGLRARRDAMRQIEEVAAKIGRG